MSAEVAFLKPEGLSQPLGYSHVVTARGGTTVYFVFGSASTPPLAWGGW